MSSVHRPIASLLAIFILLATGPAHAEPTRLTVRVLAHDAKLIGDAAGGAGIVVRNADTGAILAEGLHLGGTGSTERIIEKPWVRGETRFETDGAALFVADLDLDRPTWIEVEARAPLGSAQVRARAQSTFLMLPGRDITGDGIVLELNGLLVRLQEPDSETPLEPGKTMRVEAGVKLLCTCPIAEDSLWPARDYVVRAELWRDGNMIAVAPLSITSRTNVFAGEIEVPALEEGKGAVFELRVTASQDARANHGADNLIFHVKG